MNPLEIVLLTMAGVWQGVRQDWNLVEIPLILAAAWAFHRGWAPRWRLHIRDMKPSQACLLVAALAIFVRLALLPVLPIPQPAVTDEFSHLLLADTLLHGRVANPPHPFWQHFESLHILQQPNYISNYFPGHAAILAAGRAVFGQPWFGVLIESGVFCGVLCWMLQGWMPRRWAIFGALLAMFRFSIGSYWVNAFHGGFLAAIGGALVAGACARLRRSPTAIQGLVLGLGLATLLFTRPYEGALFACGISFSLFTRRLHEFWRAAIPAAAVAGIAFLALGTYFSKATGSPTTTPYQISQKTYGWPMALAWASMPKVEYRHVELEYYHKYEIGEREKIDGPANFAGFLAFRAQEYWRFFLGPALTLPLLAFPAIWRRKRALVLGAAAALGAVSLEGASSPHYLAPATAAIIALVVEGVRIVGLRFPALPICVLAVMAGTLTLRIAAQTIGIPYTQRLNFQSWCCKVEGRPDKARLTRWLEDHPGDHLVFVRAKTDEYNLFQWIYNAAEIDAARIVWARDLGLDQNRKLREYFKRSRAWVVDPNVDPASISAFSE